MNARFGIFPGSCHLAPWKSPEEFGACTLCKSGQENIIHLMCLGPNLEVERKAVLKKLFNERGIRTCRQALMASLDPEDLAINSAFVKFLIMAKKKLDAYV